MIRPQAHHIVFKNGIGPEQQALVVEAQAILRNHGIDPIIGPENLTLAPNVKGQHTIEALEPLVEKLRAKNVDPFTTRDDIVEILNEYGEIAASR